MSVSKNGLRYTRTLIKISGAALQGKKGSDNFDVEKLEYIANEIMEVKKQGVGVVLVVGGGNIFRGNRAQNWRMKRIDADNIGMISTIINALMLKSVLESKNISPVRVMSAINIEAVTEQFICARAISHLNKGHIVIVAAGIGHPFVTTDYAAAQRSLELSCDAMLIAKHGVDGVFDFNPAKKSDAKQYRTLSYNDFLSNNEIKIMDHAAILLARTHDLPIHIFNFDCKHAIMRICLGQNIGTYISPNTKTQFVSDCN